MSWLNENRNIVRVVILALFIVSMLGPWMFDVINVPAEYECDKPFVRLEGDFCGLPLSGIKSFTWFAGLPLIPFFTTLPLIWKKETPRLRTINLVAWILALIPTLTVFITQIKDPVIRLWGLWLYILAAVSAVIVEILVHAGERKPIN